MGKTFIGIRDVDEETFRKFKVMSVEEKMKLGVALTMAMKYFLKKEAHRKKHKKTVQHLLEVKPFDWGPGTEKTSEEIDEILYGSKK